VLELEEAVDSLDVSLTSVDELDDDELWLLTLVGVLDELDELLVRLTAVDELDVEEDDELVSWAAVELDDELWEL